MVDTTPTGNNDGIGKLLDVFPQALLLLHLKKYIPSKT